jgi:hypothetical protein
MIGIILTLAIVGFIVWLITTYIPMPPIFKTVILVVVAVLLLLWLINVLGVADMPMWHYHGSLRQ